MRFNRTLRRTQADREVVDELTTGAVRKEDREARVQSVLTA
jgi:hypothetical protein